MAAKKKPAMPARSNKGGATRGKARAAQVQKMNSARKNPPRFNSIGGDPRANL